jgi:hypothetical protein
LRKKSRDRINVLCQIRYKVTRLVTSSTDLQTVVVSLLLFHTPFLAKLSPTTTQIWLTLVHAVDTDADCHVDDDDDGVDAERHSARRSLTATRRNTYRYIIARVLVV